MRCLIGYEATPQGLDALHLGIDLARALGAELDIVIVLRRHNAFSHEYPPTGNIDDILLNQAFAWIKEAMAVVPDDVTAHGFVLSDVSTARGLTRAADERGGDIIVVGGASASPLKRHKLGSVATDLLFGSPVPVALAPRGYTRCELTRLNTAVGTRPGSGSLVRASLAVAANSNLPLRLVAMLGPGHGQDTATFARDNARAVLDEARIALGAEHISADIEIATSDDITDAIDSITWQAGDILFVGSSRVERTKSVFAGSVAMRLLRHLSCPIVIVPRGYAGAQRPNPTP